MKVRKEGDVPLTFPDDWKVEITCNTCKAELDVEHGDLHLKKWVADCGYKGMKYYYAYVLCPCCNHQVPISKKLIYPTLLREWKRQFGFEGYVIPAKQSLIAHCW